MSAILLGLSLLTGISDNRSDSTLVGAWLAERYVLHAGEEHVVTGHILFTRSAWSVLFFVMDHDTPRRGSAEGGTYSLDGDSLVFTHHYNLSVGSPLSGLPESPLQMTSRDPAGDAPREPTRIDVAGDSLTLFFPSGNRMAFRRQ